MMDKNILVPTDFAFQQQPNPQKAKKKNLDIVDSCKLFGVILTAVKLR